MNREQSIIYPKELATCPKCGCGFMLKWEDGERICLNCPNGWYINQTVPGPNQ